MKVRPFRRWSITAQLVTSYLVILGVGGLVTSLVGSYIVSTTMLEQERRTARHDLAAARSIYERHLEALQYAVRFAAAAERMTGWIDGEGAASLAEYLGTIRESGQFDFVGLTDPDGIVLVNTGQPSVRHADRVDMGRVPPVRAAPRTGPAAYTEVVPFDLLRAHDPALEARARVEAVRTAHADGAASPTPNGGMVQFAVAPVHSPGGRLLGVLYAGIVLGGDSAMVDRVDRLMYRGESYGEQLIGSVTVFQDNRRIATTVRDGQGRRAIGTLAAPDVAEHVLAQGHLWNDRAFVVNDWYVSAYEPIRDSGGTIIGMLHVGILHKLFTETRDRVIISFFAIATLGFIAIILTTYFMIRSVTRPLVQMAAITRRITSGHFDQQVRTDLPGELGLLAKNFNAMQVSLRQMHADLEEWGRTLEEKVAQRTEELVRMRARVNQSEHLASLGMLSAGVAHEINNPLGGILALTCLTLEDLPAGDDRRENLEEVVRQTERCRDIVKGLLEFSRQSETHREDIDVNDVLNRTLALIENQALFFNVKVIREWQEALPAVSGDSSELQQVFMNLIVNAVQAMHEKGVIRITTRHDVASDEVEVRVADTGSGIPADVIDRVFDPFFTTKASGEGTGLGLSIAYGIITKHEGSIGVESEPGQGTTFTVRIPALRVGAEELV